MFTDEKSLTTCRWGCISQIFILMFLMVINVLHICGKNSTDIALDKLISSEIPVKYSEKENLLIVR